ncbi:MAG: hypothetical protein HYZ84_06770 [Candidatus Omnitrophica bacterium]|nr:hypothetical protein [Candidatus Omnitrophota bacterium]
MQFFVRFALLFFAVTSILLPSTDALARKAKTFPIHLIVDFGPAGKPKYDDTITVEKGTTPKEAVSQVFPILSGKTCCSLREIMAIDGVKVDPVKNWWWTCSVNGSKKVSPRKKKLKRGDVLEWKYVEELQ